MVKTRIMMLVPARWLLGFASSSTGRRYSFEPAHGPAGRMPGPALPVTGSKSRLESGVGVSGKAAESVRVCHLGQLFVANSTTRPAQRLTEPAIAAMAGSSRVSESLAQQPEFQNY